MKMMGGEAEFEEAERLNYMLAGGSLGNNILLRMCGTSKGHCATFAKIIRKTLPYSAATATPLLLVSLTNNPGKLRLLLFTLLYTVEMSPIKGIC